MSSQIIKYRGIDRITAYPIPTKKLGVCLFLLSFMCTPSWAAQLCWQNPTENVDGSSLTDLTLIRIYWGTASRTYDQQLDVPSDVPGAELCEAIELPVGEWYMAATALSRSEQPLSDLPIVLTGATPETGTARVSLPTAGVDPVPLTLTVHDADIDNEGTITIGTWSAQLFQGQLGPDAQEHTLTYQVPRSAFVQDGPTDIVFSHTATAGYEVRNGFIEGGYDESAFSNEVLKTSGGEPTPPFVLGTPTQDGSVSLDTTLLVGETGKEVSFTWQGAAQELQLVEFGKDGAILSGSSGTGEWRFTPTRAGLYEVRMREPGGEWIRTSSMGLVFYFNLAAPTGGGID